MSSERPSRTGKSARSAIFISYRRSDTEGYAGRLQDALKAYFGEHRVFRDVGGITPGENFKDKIQQSMERAGAVIVLIGPNWLVQGEDGRPRLHDPDDHLSGEIRAALEEDRVIIPVLVEGATMPRPEDLPADLAALSMRNAVSITDAGWTDDTYRLAKVLALDISGSVAERQLDLLKRVVISILVTSMLVTFGLVFFDVNGLYEASTRTASEDPVVWVQLVAAINPLSAIVASGLLMWNKSWLDESSGRYVVAALLAAFIGLFVLFVYYLMDEPFVNGDEYHVFIASSAILTLMLGLLALSGFRPSDKTG